VSQTRGLTLGLNLSWTLVGNLVYAASQWGVLVVLAKLSDPETVGIFAYAVALTAPVFAFTNMNLRAVQATDARDDFSFGVYAAQRIAAIGVALLVIAGIVAVVVEDPVILVVTAIVGLAKAAESMSDLLYGLFQRHERLDGIGRSFIARGPAMLLAMGGLLWATGSLAWAVTGQLVVFAAVVLLHDLPFAARLLGGVPALRPTFHRGRMWALALLALPLAVVVMVQSVTINTPRYVIEHHLGAYELGMFAAMFYLVQIGQTIVKSMGQVVVPRMAKHYAAGATASFLKLGGATLAAGLAVGLGSVAVAWLAGAPLLTLIYTAEYADRTDLLGVVMTAGAVSYLTWLLSNMLNATRTFRAQVPVALAVAVAMVVGCAVWVPALGTAGGGWAWAASEAVGLVLFTAVLGWAVTHPPEAEPDT